MLETLRSNKRNTSDWQRNTQEGTAVPFSLKCSFTVTLTYSGDDQAARSEDSAGKKAQISMSSSSFASATYEALN